MERQPSPLENIISITDLREDIDALTKRLRKYRYTFVFKNRSPFFIAVEPSWFKKEILGKKRSKKQALNKRQKAASYFDKVAKEAGNWQAADVVIKMRELEKQKWAK